MSEIPPLKLQGGLEVNGDEVLAEKFKRFSAMITFAGNAAPVIQEILVNEFGDVEFTFTKTATGVYQLTRSEGEFGLTHLSSPQIVTDDVPKTLALVGSTANDDKFIIKSYDLSDSTQALNVTATLFIEVREYIETPSGRQ